MSVKPLLPDEYQSAVPEPKYIDDDPRVFEAAAKNAFPRRHPEILEVQPDGFAVPIDTALYLYRREPKAYRELVLASLSVPSSPTFWERIGAAARDALAAEDWTMLGKLAYRFELGVARCSCVSWLQLTQDAPIPAHIDPSLERVPVEPEQLNALRVAFLKTFDFQRGVIVPAAYVKSALAYWSELPAHFVMPPGCCLAEETPTADEWPLLTMFCTENASAWHAASEGFGIASAKASPLLQTVIERFKQAPRAKLPRKRRQKNPFRPLVLGLAVDPRLKRPKSDKVSKRRASEELKDEEEVVEFDVAAPEATSEELDRPVVAATGRRQGLLARMLGGRR